MKRLFLHAYIALFTVIACSFTFAADRKAGRDERTTKTSNIAPQKDSTQPSARPISSTPETTKSGKAQPVKPDTTATLAPKNPSAGEQIKWQVIASAGGTTASANYRVDMTVGQTAVGVSTSATFKLHSGFWQVFPTGCCAGLTGNVDCDPGDGVDISDLSRLVDFLYVSFSPLCCEGEANVDGQPGIDISDLSWLVDYLYVSFTPPAACQ